MPAHLSFPAVQILREAILFVEQQAAPHITTAMCHIQEWMNQHWAARRERLETPELEEGIGLVGMLSNPMTHQRHLTREDMKQDLHTITTLFRTAIRRRRSYDNHHQHVRGPDKRRTRGQRTWGEVVQGGDHTTGGGPGPGG